MLTLTDYSDATPDVTQTYDPFGRATETSNTVSTTTFAYNPATLVLAGETIVLDLNADGTPDLTRVIDRSQDTLLRTTGFELKNAATVENQNSYTYDTAGRLATVGSAPVSGAPLGVPPNVFTYDYTPNSNLLASVTGPAHTVTNSWEPSRNVLAMKENKAGATVVSNYLYSVNSIAQRTELSQTGSAFAASRSISWGYDSLGQVVSAASSIPGLDRAYLFDTIGNRIKSADSLTLPTNPNYLTNSLNQYTSVNSVTPSYDGDGNMTSGPLTSQPTANSTLIWDGENRLIQATLPDTSVVNFQYDSQSRRIAKSNATGTTLYVYDAWNPIAEYAITASGAASITRTYLWGNDLSGTLQGAGGVGGLLAVTLNNQPSTPSYFPTYDGNGNVSEYLDVTGSIVAHYEYDPFGKTTVATGAKAADFSHRFSTKPLDTQTGLYYYGYRYYDLATGRWPSRDPIEERGGINLYTFVGNDGVNKWDKLGMYTIQDAVAKLKQRGVGPEGLPNPLDTAGSGPEYSDAQKFDEWLSLEADDTGWLSTIPDCPDEICVENGKPKNCTNDEWGSLGAADQDYHPDADYCMRSEQGASRQQCCYKKEGDDKLKLIPSGDGAGTPDRVAAGGIGHYSHDVEPYGLAKDLNRTSDYLTARPPSGGGGTCYSE